MRQVIITTVLSLFLVVSYAQNSQSFDNQQLYPYPHISKGVFSTQQQASKLLDSSIVQILDLVLNQLVNNLKITYDFDGNNRKIREYYFTYSTITQLWYQNIRQDYTYTPSGDISTFTTLQWKGGSGIYENDTKVEYYYDASNRLYRTINLAWVNGKWENVSKEESSWNANGLLLQDDSYIWNGQWNQNGYTEYKYDSSDNLIELANYSFNFSSLSWQYLIKYEWLYDSLNRETSEIYLTHDSTFTSWVNYSKIESYYDSLNRVNHQKFFDWNNTLMQFDSISQKDVSYNNMNQVINQTIQFWDTGSSAYINAFKLDYTPDVNGNILEFVEYTWDIPGSNWEPNIKNESTFDQFSNWLTYRSSIWSDSSWFEYSKLLYTYDMDYDLLHFEAHTKADTASPWVQNYQADYYYSPLLGLASYDNLHFQLFPNPSSGEIHIRFMDGRTEPAEFSLINLHGSEVYAKIFFGDCRVDLTHLPTGVYVYILEQDGKVFNGRLVLR